jgi:hypothetical protein
MPGEAGLGAVFPLGKATNRTVAYQVACHAASSVWSKRLPVVFAYFNFLDLLEK